MDMTEHKKEVEKLNKIELELVKLVADTNNHQLMDKFTEFQDQRLVCNTSFAEWVDKILKGGFMVLDAPLNPNGQAVSAVGCISHTTIGTIEMRPMGFTYCCAVVDFE